MVSTQARAAALWPPDDTEWSIVGADRHQLDIMTVRGGINEEAHRTAGGRGDPEALPWQAISQIMYVGCVRPDGSAYTTYPDVMVFPRPMDRDRGSYSLAADGPPTLVVEVASPHTAEADLDPDRGKAWSYRQLGVAEYLVLDPTGLLVPGCGHGWRLEGGTYRPWEPERDGRGTPRWRSRQIGVAIGVTPGPVGRPAEGLAAVYGAGERRQPREGEIGTAIAASHQEGVEVGLAEGKRQALRLLVAARFGSVPDALEPRIASAGGAELDDLLRRATTVASAEAL